MNYKEKVVKAETKHLINLKCFYILKRFYELVISA